MVDHDEASALYWRSKHISASNSSVPTSSGVYVIGHRDSLHGFDLKRFYVYVGITQNLQRRLNEHLPETERNPELQDYLRKNYPLAMCWYAPAKANRLRAVEDDLIREIQPQFNTIGVTNDERKLT